MGADEDPVFLALPTRVRAQIDRAFDKATRSIVSSQSASPSYPPVTRSNLEDLGGGFLLDDAGPAPGGFLLDDTDDGPGGFLPPSPSAVPTAPGVNRDETDHKATHIPLSIIPTALQILDLPPADEDILSVFRNAASGWAEPGGFNARRGAGGETEGEQVVSRKDWRSVCAVLLEAAGDDGEGTEGGTEEGPGEDEMDVDDEDDRPEVLESSDDASSDEYVEPGPSSRTRQGKRKHAAPKAAASKDKPATRRTRSRKKPSNSDESDDESDSGPRPLTARQKRECLTAFAMFFPDIDMDKKDEEEKLKKKRLGVRELKAVAELLREKIKAEEVCRSLIHRVLKIPGFC